ncbi:unnamed protein product [Cuscuta campestris]|uniref:Secreted protein n=1 Tax=Cuscuta campestris TaxID=132261 RepID=A0A484M5N4_9ASTE|nr:unnamed protein product [Cuscuta campestris]
MGLIALTLWPLSCCGLHSPLLLSLWSCSYHFLLGAMVHAAPSPRSSYGFFLVVQAGKNKARIAREWNYLLVGYGS